MRDLGMITQKQATLASAEPLTLAADMISPVARHAARLALQRRPAGGRTTIDPGVQVEVQHLAVEHLRTLPAGSRLAVVVIDIARSEIVALLGSGDPENPVDGQVNGALARRSPGSTLKPFVYAAAFEAGLLNDQTTVYDVPIERAGWSPANFDQHFAGELPAGEALRRSLNVPAILVAEATGLPRCLGLIEAAGIALPRDVLTRGGLAVVVGATEVTPLDLVNGYATLGRGGIRRSPRLFIDEGGEAVRVLDADICATIDDILSSRHRRPRGMHDRDERKVPWFMWKTGTSSGRRDAWAVGHNRRYAIGVWVGRFSGAGSERFIGAEAAEPLLASLFDLPILRCREDPPVPAPKRLPVPCPLPPPTELASPLRIVSPTPEATYIALGGQAIIHARATRPAGLTWFLDGMLVDGRGVQRLIVGPGRHELRCVDSQGEGGGGGGGGEKGEAAVVGFTILSRPAGPDPPRAR
jgi:penicillin-binding protein 1C